MQKVRWQWLTSLPDDLLEKVCTYLNGRDFVRATLSCRSVESAVRSLLTRSTASLGLQNPSILRMSKLLEQMQQRDTLLSAIECKCCSKGIPGWVVRSIDSIDPPVLDERFHSFFYLLLYGDYMTSKCAQRIMDRARIEIISTNVDSLSFWMMARHDKRQFLKALISRCYRGVVLGV